MLSLRAMQIGEYAHARTWRRAICAAALVTACGSGASTSSPGADGSASEGCAAGETYCAGCGGGGFCSQVCPGLQCPVEAGAGDAAVGDGGLEGGACPSISPTSCADCSGGTFCVAGACPATTCPLQDAGGAEASPQGDGATGAPCRTSTDCSTNGAAFCVGPVPPVCTCGVGSCTSDLQCAPDGGNRICESFCGGTCTQFCVPGCTDTTCSEGARCGASHRCEPKPCAGASDCPAQFDCVQSACQRRSCQRDSQCPAGYCVEGSCSAQLGMCAAGAA